MEYDEMNKVFARSFKAFGNGYRGYEIAFMSPFYY